MIEEDVDAPVQRLLDALNAKINLKVLGEGRHRRGYLTKSGRYVLKVPIHPLGELANRLEADDYKNDNFLGKEYLARCKIVIIDNIECLLMDRVTSAGEEELPDWTGFVDCGQVGYNCHGKLVAYDWATVR